MSTNGDFPAGSTVQVMFTTHAQAGGAIAPSTSFEAADVQIYKDDSSTPKTTTNGLTMTSPVNSVTGLHRLDIDTSNNTGDTGFWADGHNYHVVLKPSDETVDGQTVVRVIGYFQLRAAVTDSSSDIAAIKAQTDKLTFDGDNNVFVVLADGVAHGGTPGSSTATLALLNVQIKDASGTYPLQILAGNGASPILLSGDGTQYAGLECYGGDGPGMEIRSGGNNDAIIIAANGTGHGLSITGAGTGKHDIALVGSGDAWDGVNNQLISALVGDKTGFALTSAYDPAKTASQAGDAMTLTGDYDSAKTAAQAGDAMTLDGTQDWGDGTTTADVMQAAYAQGGGDWALDVDNKTLTLKLKNGATFLTFGLDSATVPTTRTKQ